MLATIASGATSKGVTRTKIPSALFLVLILHSGLVAQDAGLAPGVDDGVRVFGSVVNRTTEEPIASASIAIVQAGLDGDTAWTGVSDTDGRFRTDVLPVGGYELAIDALPFSPLSHLLVLPEAGIVDVLAQMVRVDFALEPVVVSARRLTKLEREGFYERRQRTAGYFLSREDIRNRAAMRVSDLFRTIPGARVIQGAFGRGDIIRLRGGCLPVIVLDGIAMGSGLRIDELFTIAGLEGIEVHHSATAPPQYAGMTTCGVIMLWSREPVSGEGGAITWTRGLVAAGLAVLIFFGAR